MRQTLQAKATRFVVLRAQEDCRRGAGALLIGCRRMIDDELERVLNLRKVPGNANLRT